MSIYQSTFTLVSEGIEGEVHLTYQEKIHEKGACQEQKMKRFPSVGNFTQPAVHPYI
jgi:hypothetical protein